MEQIVMGLREAAASVGLSPWTLRAWIRQDKLRCVRLGRRVMVEPEELHRVVQREKRPRSNERREPKRRRAS
jgi:excisionase family DNA binding protein